MLTGLANTAGRLMSLARGVEDYWFDATRSIRTSTAAELDGLHLAGDRREAFMYLPARAKNSRAALASLPLASYQDYRFIDLGSGIGRTLFVAAEFPFRSILGVEIAAELHALAEANILRFRSRTQRCHAIQSVHSNALDFSFPRDNLVVFMFNPFGPGVLRDVLTNLERSLAEHPRDVFVVMLYPDFAHVVDASSRFLLFSATPRHRIYRSTVAQ